MLRLESLRKSFATDFGNKKIIFDNLNLEVKKGDFISIIGSNGAGKSTLLNTISGTISIDEGIIQLEKDEITNLDRYKRNKFISKVHQDPTLGTAPSMTIFENLSIADNKGKKFNLSFGLNKKRKDFYRELLEQLNLGLENQMDIKVKFLSGGQRQCLALIMAILGNPKVLLLDEHTAALDPKTSKIIMDKTTEIVEKNNISTLMITHNLQDAIEYGNRLIMLHEGKIILDLKGEQKKNLNVSELFSKFSM